MEEMNDNVSSLTCDEYKTGLTAGLEPYRVLSFTVPLNSTVWTERNEAWMICFYIYIAVMSPIFLVMGVASIMLLIKKDCIRLPTKTFFAIYMAIAILCFSRALWLLLDPFGLVGFIAAQFPGWFILSRMLEAFGYPSLVSSYTLVIFTLLKVAKPVPGKQWYHYWKFIVPILLSPYLIAFGAELIANFAPNQALLTVVICELFFTVWSFLVCVSFLFAGNRLLRQLRLRGRKTIRVSAVRLSRANMEAEMNTRHEFASREQQRHQARTRRTTRKITIITYGTALFSITYSLLTTAGTIMVCLLLYNSCLGFQNQLGLSPVWLAIEISKRINEIVLVFVLLYSVTDIAGVIKVLHGMCCRKRVVNCDIHNNYLHKNSSQMSMLSRSGEQYTTRSTESLNDIANQEALVLSTTSADQSIQNDSHILDSTEDNHVPDVEVNSNSPELSHSMNPDQPQNPQQYLLVAQGESNSSLGSDSVSPSTSMNREHPQTSASINKENDQSTGERKSTKHRNPSLKQKTVGTQTVQIADHACQTEPELSIQARNARVKPVPKPRRFRPRLSRKQAANAQRIAALRQSPGVFTSLHDRFARKQTI